MENEKLTKTNRSVEKALQVLEILASSESPMRLIDISRAAGLPAPTALRMVNTLVCCGYVQQDSESQVYSLTYKVCSLSKYAKENQLIVRAAKPFIISLAARCHEVITLAAEVDNEVQFIHIEEQHVSGLTVAHQSNIKVPYHIAAVGKLMLLNYAKDKIRELYNEDYTIMTTPRTIRSFEALIAELHKTVERGYAINDEESELGARCVACPVFDFTGRVCAGIGISGPSSRMTDDFIRNVLPLLKNTTDKVSEKLGYAGGETVLDSWN